MRGMRGRAPEGCSFFVAIYPGGKGFRGLLSELLVFMETNRTGGWVEDHGR